MNSKKEDIKPKYANQKKADRLIKELNMWKDYSDIAIDMSAQTEYRRLEKELKKLERHED